MKTYHRMSQVVLLIALLSGSAVSQFNQSALLSATSDKTTVTNYYFARPNDLTFVVNVLGHVQRPGRYEIASSIDLLSLISLAGGPTPDGTLDDVTVSRIIVDSAEAASQSLGRVDLAELIARTSAAKPDSTRGNVVYSRGTRINSPARWKKITFDLSGTKFYDAEDMQLHPGDVVTIGRSGWAQFQDVASLIVPVALVINVVLQVITLSK